MKADVGGERGFTRVALAGEIDLNRVPKVRREILRQVDAGHSVLVDLSEVSYLDSSGVATLVEGFQAARTQGLEFAVTGVSEAAMRVLNLSRLDQVLPIIENAGAHDRHA